MARACNGLNKVSSRKSNAAEFAGMLIWHLRSRFLTAQMCMQG